MTELSELLGNLANATDEEIDAYLDRANELYDRQRYATSKFDRFEWEDAYCLAIKGHLMDDYDCDMAVGDGELSWNLAVMFDEMDEE